MPTSEELERRFTYHAPDEGTRELHNEWRRHERWYAEHLKAFTALEEMTFWGHAHIARNLHPKED